MGISFFQRGTNEINLIAMHNIINYELNGQKNEEELMYHSTDAIQQRWREMQYNILYFNKFYKY